MKTQTERHKRETTTQLIMGRDALRQEEKQTVKLNIYAIRDTKAEAYLLPFFERTNQTALRVVEKAIDTDANFNAYAEDYGLWLLGTWDDANGCVKGEVPLHLANLVDIRDSREKAAGVNRELPQGGEDPKPLREAGALTR